MKEHDGLKLLVQFYANNGALRQVEEKTGVSVEHILAWLNGGDLSGSDRSALESPVDIRFTGEVLAGFRRLKTRMRHDSSNIKGNFF